MKLRNALFAVLAAAIPAVTVAQVTEVELIPRSSFLGNPSKVQGLISPDGKWISWIAPRDGVLNIWVAPASDPSKAKPLTEEKVRPIRQHFWARNSKTILFINDRGGDENYLLYGVSPEGGALKSYTKFEKTRVIPIGGSRKHADEILIGLNNRNAQWHDVYRLNTVTGNLKLVYQNDQYGAFESDEDLNLRLAFKEKAGGGQDVFRFKDGKVEPFSTIPAEDSITTNSLNISADGKTLFWIDSRGRDKAALVAQDLASGTTRMIGESGRGDISGVMTNPATLAPEAYAVNYLRKEWTPVADGVKADVDALNSQVKGQWEVVSRDDADTKWIVYVDEVTKPISYALYDRKARKVSTLFVTRPALEGKPLAPMYGREIKARDGLTIVSFLTLPVGSSSKGDGVPDKPLPMILNVHGGPWAQDKFGYNAEAQWMANRGYAVLQVNYRGSTGFGKGFVEAANHEFGGKMHDDLIDFADWAVAEGIADPTKIAIYGGSYGGYAALVGATFTPETFTCAIDVVGPSDLRTLIRSIPPYWAPLVAQFHRRVGNPETEPDFLWSRSPLSRVDAIRIPMLIAQGANDPRVKKEESEQIVAAMTERGIPHRYLVFEDEGHGFRKPENNLAFHAAAEQFLAEHLGGRLEPAHADEGTAA